MQLIHGIPNDLQNLLKYFSGTTIFAFTGLFVLLVAASVSPTRADLYLSDSELLILKSALLAGTSSLLNYHKLPVASE